MEKTAWIENNVSEMTVDLLNIMSYCLLTAYTQSCAFNLSSSEN